MNYSPPELLWKDRARAFADYLCEPDNIYNTKLRPKIYEDIRRFKPCSALDYGCGTGHLVNELHEIGFSAIGLEPVQEMYNISKENFPECRFVCGYADALSGKKFDLLTVVNVLNNLPCLKTFVGELDLLACHGSRVYLIMENPNATEILLSHTDRRVHYDQYSVDNGKAYASHFLGTDKPIFGFHRNLDEIIEEFSENGFQLLNREGIAPVPMEHCSNQPVEIFLKMEFQKLIS